VLVEIQEVMVVMEATLVWTVPLEVSMRKVVAVVLQTAKVPLPAKSKASSV
jgi:hypothetical protein